MEMLCNHITNMAIKNRKILISVMLLSTGEGFIRLKNNRDPEGELPVSEFTHALG